MRFRGLDLNLLGAFDVLIQERSVSSAARKLNLSQPAMSAALARLREFFGDDILIVHGKRMFPTSFAERLAPQVRQILGEVDEMLANRGQFDPATTHRTFRLIASDYIVAAVIVPLIERLSIESPGIMLELAAPTERGPDEIAAGVADLMISPDYYIMGEHPSELLFEESHVVVGWQGNPLLDAPLTLQTFLGAGHVGVRIGAQRQQSFADRAMSVMGHSRRIEVETHSFLTIPLLLEGTQRLALMQARLAERLSRQYPLQAQPLPFDFPVMREMMQYHTTRQNDLGLTWLKSLLKRQSEVA
ncbi:LysR family transcriptional regulator [Sphingomonas sp.]|uniref:LysR family transcriptional regulator n=1 Tax=Sphingomonas sp. TaxID=28214 RepID=UPI0031DFD7BF